MDRWTKKIQFWKEFQKQFEAVGAVCRSHRAAGGQKPVKQHQQLVAVPNSLKPVATLAYGGFSSKKGSSICMAGRFSLCWISLRSFSESANAGFIHLWNQNHNWRLVGASVHSLWIQSTESLDMELVPIFGRQPSQRNQSWTDHPSLIRNHFNTVAIVLSFGMWLLISFVMKLNTVNFVDG